MELKECNKTILGADCIWMPRRKPLAVALLFIISWTRLIDPTCIKQEQTCIRKKI